MIVIIISLHIVAVLVANVVHRSKLAALYREIVTAYNGFRDVTIAIRGAKLKQMLSANNLWIFLYQRTFELLSIPKDFGSKPKGHSVEVCQYLLISRYVEHEKTN